MKWAHMVTGIAARLALLHPVLTAAADVDEQAASLNAVSERNRLGGAMSFVEQLQSLEALRGDLSVERAAAMASLLMDPLGYRRLVLGDGWTEDEYARWVTRLTTPRSCRTSPLPVTFSWTRPATCPCAGCR